MSIWQSLIGVLEVEITSADIPAALKDMTAHNIPISHLEQIGDLTSCFRIKKTDYKRLIAIAQKRGDCLNITGRTGIYWTIKQLKKRLVLVAGLLLIFFLTLVLPTRIYFIRISGNDRIASREILSAAEKCGIRFGTPRKIVRSEKMKNALLEVIPGLQWAGINTHGCVAEITVREGEEEPPSKQIEKNVCSIVSSMDGVITQCTVVKGNPLCRVGQAVKVGDVLISGYSDTGLCITATRAEGEIFAQTSRSLQIITPNDCFAKTHKTKSQRRWSLLVGKKRINLWIDSGIWDSSCGRIYREYTLRLPGGFILPICAACDTYVFQETVVQDLPMVYLNSGLSTYAEDYLHNQMIAGSVCGRQETLAELEHAFLFTGEYTCREMIGALRWEMSEENHGENS